MRSTWLTIIFLVVGFTVTAVLSGCGGANSDADNLAEVGNSPITPSPVIEPIAPVAPTDPDLECTILTLLDPVDTACTRVVIGSTVLANRQDSATTLTLTASKKNGGSGGTKWFDSRATVSPATDFALPLSIPAQGNAGNGQKLYMRFNDTLDCAWYSFAANQYRNPRCFIGATRNGGASSGFSGGTEVNATKALAVTSVKMTVNGSSGGGVLTTAVAVLSRQ